MKRRRIVLVVVVLLAIVAFSLWRRPVKTDLAQDPAVQTEKDREAAARTASTADLQKVLEARTDSVATPRDTLARGFRDTFPFHTQVLALSDPASDSSRTLIISEPPPYFTIGEVLAPLAKVLRNHSVVTTKVGYDGWVQDVAASISGSDADISAALSAESRRIFGTSYKSYVLPLPAKRSASGSNLDLSVTPAEVQQWLANGATFLPVEGGNAVTASEIVQASGSKVYVSRSRGLVAWWLPKTVSVTDCRVQVRQFAIDSDLVIGAAAKPTGLIILGRERQVPVDLLPPLRYETVELLAAVQHGSKGQLAQSYERLHPFAGRLSNGRDWAPILLSPELIDTEYGSLLNITDQLLKGWSNAGQTHYANFKYAIPGHYPFGSEAVSDTLGASTLVYNWNTKGAGYVVAADDSKVFAINRAGALPVTYIPEGMDVNTAGPQVMAAEDAAYDYFGRMSDPNLVRVVQYAAIYQIFSAFGVQNRNIPEQKSSFQSTRLEELTNQLAGELKNASDQELSRIAHDIAPGYPEELIGFDETAEMVVQRELTGYRADEKPLDPFTRDIVLSLYADKREIPQTYAKEVAAKSSAWIHTPAVVVSWNDIDPTGIAIGGHNLDAEVTNVALSRDVATVKVAEDGSIQLNQELGPEARSLIRTAGRFKDESPAQLEARLQRILESVPKTPPRAIEKALELAETPIHEPPGFTPVAGAAERGSLRLVGWGRRRTGAIPKDIAHMDADSAAAVVVERRADAIYVRHSPDEAPIEAFNVEDATDALVTLLRRDIAGGRELHIELRGFQQEDGQGFLRSCQVRVGDENMPAEVTALVRDKSLGDDALRALRQEKFDFSKVKIEAGTLEELPTELRQTMTVEVPRMDGGDPGHGVIDLAFVKETPPGVISRICEAIKSAVNDIVADLGQHFDAVVFNYRLSAAIKRISTESGVDIRLVRHQFRAGQRDIYFAQRQDGHDGIATRLDSGRRPA
ncbi:MAG TPA: hypothetical protein VGQ21_12470 [Thermoanaerobaculia bacterium]|jgi:hypothetical protein|nr:hypothetical protein [Thermoanaerobaculia bacterium]